ncbi:MAG TPA: ATP-binding protein [Caulobacteraceae bacterium]|jgi:signal transduction histidine kinase
MASEHRPPASLPLRLAIDALVLAAVAVAVAELLLRTHLYATALVVAAFGAMVLADIVRTAGRADVILSQILDRLTGAVSDRARERLVGFPALAQAADVAADRLRRGSQERQREIEGLKALLDTTPAALFILGDDGTVDLANRAAFALAGREVRRLDDFPQLGPAREVIAGLRAGGRAVLTMADDRKIFVSVSQLSHPAAGPVRLVALQPIAGELDVVEQAAWRDLMRVLAHEIMNSLTPIASLSESLARRLPHDAEAETRGVLEVIARRSENLMGFVDRYRLVADTPPPIRAPVPLGAFARDITRLLAGSFTAARAELTLEVEPPELEVEADRSLLEQAVINLLKNALDASRARPAPKVVLLCAAAEDGPVTITVRDNGEGVPPERLETIFVPFYTSRSGGSGIGLSLARQIAQAHGGQLIARNNEDGGATFEMSLPRVL